MMLAYIELDPGDWVRPDLVIGLSHDLAKGKTIVILTGNVRFNTDLPPMEVLERIDYAVRKTQGLEVPERDTSVAVVADTLADDDWLPS